MKQLSFNSDQLIASRWANSIDFEKFIDSIDDIDYALVIDNICVDMINFLIILEYYLYEYIRIFFTSTCKNIKYIKYLKIIQESRGMYLLDNIFLLDFSGADLGGPTP